MHLLTPPTETYAALPPHVLTEPGGCRNCNALDVDGHQNYDAYVEHFYAFEYEGERSHRPMERDEWEYLQVSCLGGDEGGYAVPATPGDESAIRARLASH